MEEDKFIDAFKNLKYSFQKSKLCALDLGCRDTLKLSYLHQSLFNFKNFVAVDEGSIEHLDYLNQDGIISDKLLYIEDRSFTDAKKYLQSSNKDFDLIILSNFLHLFKETESKEILHQCIQRLKFNGIIYLCVANHNHKKEVEDSDLIKWRMDILELTDFIKPLEVIYSDQSGIHTKIFAKRS